jgi:hypothetical protein
MPVARIYASLVEESEPLCSDLLARGYDVEVVFPDAVLPAPADLELRVERCSAEQAIARVESGAGLPSRYVFVTHTKAPRQELLLVEMSVPATGTNGRHPVSIPATAHLANGAASALPEPVGGTSVNPPTENPTIAAVLPFPSVSLGRRRTDALPQQKPAPEHDDAVLVTEQQSSLRPVTQARASQENLNKNMIAEVNQFLAHAPSVEPDESFSARMLEDFQLSKGLERVRKNWEALTLLGIAVSFVVLVSVGWYAAPTRPRFVAAEMPASPTHDSASVIKAAFVPAVSSPVVSSQTVSSQIVSPQIVPPEMVPPSVSVGAELGRTPIRAHKPTTAPVHVSRAGRFRWYHPSRRKQDVRDDLIGRDDIARADGGLLNKPHTPPSLTAPIGRAPIKKITDLK